MSNNNQVITKEELELFRNLQKKVKEVRKQAKEVAIEALTPMLNAMDVDKVINALTISGGERISSTIKLSDGKTKLNITVRDVTKGVDEEE